MAPNHDQQIHGDQHEFPKKEKQKQIDRQEHPDYTAEGEQDVAMKQSDAVLNFCPGSHRRDDADEDR